MRKAVGYKWLKRNVGWYTDTFVAYKKEYGLMVYRPEQILENLYKLHQLRYLTAIELSDEVFELFRRILPGTFFVDIIDMEQNRKPVWKYSRERDHVRACKKQCFKCLNKYLEGKIK
jgi:hypothetical protein